jgi:hypothetical protein
MNHEKSVAKTTSRTKFLFEKLIFAHLVKPEVYCRVHMGPQLILVLSRMYPSHILNPISFRSRIKVKLYLYLMKHQDTRSYGGVETYLHAFLPTAMDGDEWPASHFGWSIPGEGVPDTHWIGGCVHLRDALEKINISCPCQESDPDSSVVQAIA